jgi:hypothetical protein
MFEQIFTRQSTIRRHRQGPLAEERRRYLAFKAEGGATWGTLHNRRLHFGRCQSPGPGRQNDYLSRSD